MRKREAYMQEVERPLKHKMLAMALSLLMLMNMAPEYGFGLSVRAHADETAPDTHILITSDAIGQWMGNGEEPTVSLLPGGDREFGAEVAKDAFMGLFDRPFVHEQNLNDSGIFYIAAQPDGAATRGDLFYYNRSGAPDVGIFLGQGYSAAEDEMVVYEPVITETANDAPQADAVLAAPETPDENAGEGTEEGVGEGTTEEETNGSEIIGDGGQSETDKEQTVTPGQDETDEPGTEEPSEAPSEEDLPQEEAEGLEEDEPADGGNFDGETDTQDIQDSPEESGGSEEGYVETVQVESAYVVRSDVLSDYVEGEESGEGDLQEGAAVGDGETTGTSTQTFAVEYQRNSGAGVHVNTYQVDGGTVVGLSNVPEGQIVKLPFYGTSADRLEEVISNWLNTEKPILQITLGNKDEIKAGEAVYGEVGFAMPTPPLYTDGVAPKAPAFEKYDEVAVEIRFTPGLKVILGNDTAAELTGDAETGLTLTYRGDGSWTPNEFTFNAETTNDGSAVGKTFGIMSASIVGKVNGLRDAVYDVDVAAFEQKLELESSQLPTFVPSGSETWSISHELKNTVISKADGKVTLEYVIGAGLAGSQGPIGVRGAYDMPGRLGFEDGTFTLREQLPTFTNIYNEPITPLASKMELLETAQSSGVAGGQRIVTGAEGQSSLEIGAYCVGPKPESGDGYEYLVGAMPFYTEYKVTVEYPYDAFVVPFEKYEEMLGKDYVLTATAQLSYHPKGQQLVSTEPVAASTKAILESGGKGDLTIEKYIQEGKGATAARLLYDFKTAQVYQGGADFKIVPKGNVKLPANMNPAADGSAIVTLNPTEENAGNSISLTLSPGEYDIYEVRSPEGAETKSPDGTDYSKKPITVTVGDGPATAKFTDMSVGRGAVKFVKTDERKNPLKGVLFTITGPKDDANPVTQTAESDGSGVVYFQGLKPGTYTIKETQALAGYAPWTEDVTVTVKPEEIVTPEVPVNVNLNQDLVVKLQIRQLNGAIRDPQGDENGRFTALIWPSTGSKETAARVKLTGKETTVKGLPAYTVENGKAAAIQYYISEDLTSEATYDLVDEKSGASIDSIAMPLYESGKRWETTVTNGYTGSVQLVKSLEWYKEGGKAPENQSFAFQLYDKDKKNPVQFHASTANGGQVDSATVVAGSSQGLTASGLAAGEYFWKEVQGEGADAYTVFYSTDNKVWTEATDGFVPAGQVDLTPSKVYVRNVPKKVRLVVEKQDENGKALSGAEFQLKQGGTVVKEKLDGSGNLFWADVTQGSYTLVETKAPDNYVKAADKEITIAAPTAGEAKVHKEIVKNVPNPTLTVEKTVIGEMGKDLADGQVRFRLYKGDSQGPSGDSLGEIKVTLKDGVQQANPGSLKLPQKDDAGQEIHYWLTEDSVPLYQNNPQVPVLLKSADNIDVGALPATGTKTQLVSNLLNFATVKIAKTDGTKQISGAGITVSNAALGISVSGTSGGDGLLSFVLPVYQVSDGVRTPIEYTVTETQAPNGYIKTDSTFKFTFADVQTEQTAGQAYDAEGNALGAANAPLTFVNTPYITIIANKTVTGWGDELNSGNVAARSLKDVVLGLYQKNEAGDKYTWVATEKTDALGLAIFGGQGKNLPADKEYRVYELYDPNGYAPSADGKRAVLDSADGEIPTEIAANSDFYYSDVKTDGTAGSYGLSVTTSLTNQDGWVQFKGTKVSSVKSATGEKIPLNLAHFSLYRLELPESGTEVTYDPEALKGMKPYKEYTSGYTAGKAENLREPGVFYTDVLEHGYLYWLVEDQAPPEYDPEKTVVFGMTPENSGVTIKDNDPSDGITVKEIGYKSGLNDLSDIENTPKTGGDGDGDGTAYAYTALILDKVLGAAQASLEDCTDVADVTFELWLRDGTQRIKLVDTLVTGKDATESKVGVGRAFSQPINLKKLYDEVHGAHPNAVIKSAGEGENATYKATLELVETKMPQGMKPDGKTYTVTIDTAEALKAKDQVDEFNKGTAKKIVQGNEGYVLLDMTYTKDNKKPVRNIPVAGTTITIRKYGYVPKNNEELKAADAELAQKKDSLNGLVSLNGVKFNILNVNPDGSTSIKRAVTTDANGAAQVQLENGYYKLVEIQKHPDYANRNAQIFFTVQGESQTIEVFNPKTPEIRLQKNDGAIRDGITFKLGNNTFKNPAAGSNDWTIKVQPGSYKLTESVTNGAVSGAYFGNGVTVTVNVDGTVSLTGEGPVTAEGNLIKVYNPETGSLKINKVDGATNAPITKEASFEVKYMPFGVSYENGKVVFSQGEKPQADAKGWKNAETVKVTGSATQEKLNPGWYMVTEKVPPEGYAVNTESEIVPVNPGGTAEVTISDTAHGKLTVSKRFDWKGVVGAEQAQYPKTVTFTVTPANPGVSVPPITVPIGSDGQGALSAPISLAAGQYKLTETAVTGWNIEEATVANEGGSTAAAENPASFDIEIVSGKTTAVAVKNATTAASVTVEKVDSAGSPIEGVKFTLAGQGYSQEAITDPAGHATFIVPNPQGAYTLKETEAPPAFVVPAGNGVSLTLTPGQVYTAQANPELRITNTRGVMINAVKYEGIPGKTTGTLDGVPLILEKKVDGVWQTLSTESTKDGGKAVFGNLTEGEYAIREGESTYKDHKLAGVTVGGQTAAEDPESPGRYLLGSLTSGEVQIAVFNRKPQTLTITKWELGKENDTGSTASASYDIYAVEAVTEPGAPLPEGAELVRKVPEGHVANVPLQPGVYYVQETASRYLQLDNEDPRTPTSRCVTIEEGQDASLTFVNAPKASSLKPVIEKKAVDPAPTGNPLYGEQPASFQLAGFAKGDNVISLDSVTVNDDGLQFFTEPGGKNPLTSNAPNYRLDTITVGGASYDVIASDGTAASAQNVRVTLSVDGVEHSTKSLPATFTVNGGKGFSLKYTAENGKLGPHFKAEPVMVEMTVLKQAETTGETKMVRSAVNSANAVYSVNGADMASAKATAFVNFPLGDELPPMDLQKSSAPTDVNVDIGGTITYTLTLSNHSADKGIQKPVIVDLLPAGVEMTRFEDGSLVKAGEGQPTPGCYVKTDENGRQYVQFPYSDTLEAGKSFTVTYQVQVQATIMDGSVNPQAVNKAWATSLNRLPQHDGNPYGLSFKAVNGKLIYAADDPDLDFVESAMLNGKYGYVFAQTKNGVQNANNMQLVKEVTTTTENGKYYKNKNTAKAALGDTITYRLTMINGSKREAKNIRIVDILPTAGDSRGSVWTPEYVGNVKASIAGKSVGVNATGSSEVYSTDAAKTLMKGTEQLSATGADTRTLLLDLGPATVKPNETLQITFEMKATESAPDQLYRAATNTFWVNYQGLLTQMESNPASVVLVPDSVSVGGRIWIDENGNGVLDGNEAANEDWKGALTQGDVTLVEHGQTDTQYFPAISADGLFLQDKLTAAKENGGVLYKGNDLQAGGLLGNPPTTYALRVTPAEGFGLTGPYGGNDYLKRSLSAETLKTTTNGRVISHFGEQGNTWISEQFYLWPTEYGTDEFKNVGLIRTRDLTVNKSESGTSSMLAGAEFALYGPFDDVDSVTAEMLEGMTPLETGITDNGKLTFKDLMYYQAYILKETRAAENYTPTGAMAPGFTKLEGAEAWIVPKGLQGNIRERGDVTLNVENNRQKASMTIRKVMAEGGSALPEDVFTFQIMIDGQAYKVSEGQAAGEGVTVTADGKIQFHVNEQATVTGLPAGQKFEILETVPENAGYAPAPEITYETGKTILTDGADGTIRNHVTVINSNNSNGSVKLGGRKELTGQTLQDGQFQFQLLDKATGTVLQTVKNTGGAFAFEPILYTRADIGKTFTYIIKEVVPAEADRKGVTYDETSYEVTVAVKAGGETGVITQVTGDQDDRIVFRNTYGAAGEITLGALKRTVGANLEKDQFAFVLTDTATGQTWQARNEADGTIRFLPPIVYTETGEHEYTIAEVDEHKYGYTYDDKIYRVSVTVTDPEGNGVLHTEAFMDDKPFDSNDAVFINRFSNLSLNIYKYRHGSTNTYLNGAEFALYKYDEEAAYHRGVLVGSGTTASGGRLRFENLDAGKYVLVETYVPRHYETLESQYVVQLGYDGNNNTSIEVIAGGNHSSVHDGTLYVPNRYRRGGGGDDDDDDDRDRDRDRDYGREDDPRRDGGDQPLTQIPEPAVPLSDAPNPLTEIPDEDVPLGALPNTGGFPVGAFAVIGGLLALLGIKIKKRKQSE